MDHDDFEPDAISLMFYLYNSETFRSHKQKFSTLDFSSRKSEEGLSITEEIEEDISIGSFAGSKVGTKNFPSCVYHSEKFR